jgi:hypothetical protein
MYNPQWHIEALHRLESVNFTREQGETLMELIEERQQIGLADLATKRDIDDLRKDTRHDIETLRLETRLEFEKLRSSMKFYFLGIFLMTLVVQNAQSLLQFVMNLLK